MPNTIPWMASKKAIKFEDHKVVQKSNCRSRLYAFIICFEGEDVGQIRYNIDKTLGEKVAG